MESTESGRQGGGTYNCAMVVPMTWFSTEGIKHMMQCTTGSEQELQRKNPQKRVSRQRCPHPCLARACSSKPLPVPISSTFQEAAGPHVVRPENTARGCLISTAQVPRSPAAPVLGPPPTPLLLLLPSSSFPLLASPSPFGGPEGSAARSLAEPPPWLTKAGALIASRAASSAVHSAIASITARPNLPRRDGDGLHARMPSQGMSQGCTLTGSSCVCLYVGQRCAQGRQTRVATEYARLHERSSLLTLSSPDLPATLLQRLVRKHRAVEGLVGTEQQGSATGSFLNEGSGVQARYSPHISLLPGLVESGELLRVGALPMASEPQNTRLFLLFLVFPLFLLLFCLFLPFILCIP